MIKRNCANCKNMRICRYYPGKRDLLNIDVPGWETIEAVHKFLIYHLAENCDMYDPIQIYEDRDMNGVLIGHKPLKIWYPNQKPKLEDVYGTPNCKCYACVAGHYRECYHKRNKPNDDYGLYRVSRYAEKYGYNK